MTKVEKTVFSLILLNLISIQILNLLMTLMRSFIDGFLHRHIITGDNMFYIWHSGYSEPQRTVILQTLGCFSFTLK